MSHAIRIVMNMGSDNASGADNQQGRLDAYIAGYVDGEGSFHVAVQRNPSTRVGWQLVPEFHVSQNPERRQVLDLIRERFGCGRIRENHRGSTDISLVFVVRARNDLLTRVIPFFEAEPLMSSKQQDFEKFAEIVRAMSKGCHLLEDGFEELRAIALFMNGEGRYRRIHRVGASRTLRDHTPNTVPVHTES
jgi:LAGLIDADG endonuclease